MPSRLSFQLYSARNFQPWDQVLSMVAKAGYKDVEGFGGVYENPKAFRAMLDANGLAMPSGHFSIDMLEKEGAKVLAIAQTLGLRQIYAPYLPQEQRPKSGAGWKAFGKRLASINSWVRSEGYGFGWHNHDFEFARLKDGSTPHERIYDAAPYLDWECDVAWVAFAKQNPVKWIKAYAGSITAVHVKDIAPAGRNLDQDGWCDVGEGTVKWPEIFKALTTSRVIHYVMEHDNPNDVAGFAKASIAFCKKH